MLNLLLDFFDLKTWHTGSIYVLIHTEILFTKLGGSAGYYYQLLVGLASLVIR